MITTLIIRFIVGGTVVAAFALIAEVVGPKSFAGMFGAAPSVAIATLALTIGMEGKLVAAQESHAMVFGGLAFFAYACCCFLLLAKRRWTAKAASVGSLFVWLAVAFSLYFAFFK
jgi:Protein of unknown function (DUF3147)